ncbi:MAG: hypothetical protein EBY22_16245, partial [Gammaproteobacteria bacterium]|nr:hypothetical protein [Gammaproteobacteria bacterium]
MDMSKGLKSYNLFIDGREWRVLNRNGCYSNHNHHEEKIDHLAETISTCYKLTTIYQSMMTTKSTASYNDCEFAIRDNHARFIKDVSKVVCSNCDRPGHVARNCRSNPTRNQKTPMKPKAFYASTNDEVSPLPETTPVLIPSSLAVSRPNDSNICDSINFTSSHSYALLTSNGSGTGWILDSGASHTMTWDKTVFLPESLRPSTERKKTPKMS